MNRQDHSRMRRVLLARLAAGAALGGGVTALIREALAQQRVSTSVQVVRSKGSVAVTSQAIQAGGTSHAGTTVVTGPSSEAVLLFGKDAFLQRENTSASFGTEPAKELLRVASGKIMGVFGQGEKKLVTGTAVIGIRGTGCYIEAEAERTYFCLCYGEAEVTPTADPSRREMIRSAHHDRPIYIHAVTGDKCTVPAAVINHTDAELTMLEALVGRKPAFARSGAQSRPAADGRDHRISY